MKVRELIKKIADFDGIEIRDFETGKRLTINIKNAEKYFDCEVKDYDYYDTLENETAFSEYYLLKIFIQGNEKMTTVRELLKQIFYYEVVEIRDFEGKNLIAIEDLDRFYDCEVKDFNYVNDYSLNDFESFYVLKIFIQERKWILRII